MVLRPIRPAGLPRAEAPWATVDHLPAGSPGGPGRRTPGAGDGTEEGDRRRRRAGGARRRLRIDCAWQAGATRV